MATKEVLVSAPLMNLLYDRTFVAGTVRGALRARGWYYGALAATWLVLAALMISAEGRGGTAGFGVKMSPVDYALTQCGAIVHYLRLALWPEPLVFDYGTLTATAGAGIIGPALLLFAFAVGTLVALRTRPMWGFLGAWFFAVLSPSSSVVPIATQTIAEHRMYLALAPVLLLIGVALFRGLGRRPAMALGWLTAISLALAMVNRLEEALRHFERAVALRPDFEEAARNRTRARAQLSIQ